MVSIWLGTLRLAGYSAFGWDSLRLAGYSAFGWGTLRLAGYSAFGWDTLRLVGTVCSLLGNSTSVDIQKLQTFIQNHIKNSAVSLLESGE